MKTSLLFILTVVVTGLVAPTRAHAQEAVTTQLWMDYVEEWVFKPKHLLELEVGPKTLISGGEYWAELTVTPAYEYTPNGRWDLVARTLFSWVRQTQSLSTFEIRPIVGFKVYVSTDRVARWIIRDFNRIEGRFIYYKQPHEWQDTYRYRNRLELQYALTANTLVADNMLYALVDAEIFVNLGAAAEETFNDNWRFRVGIGRRMSYTWRFEFLYTHMLSRDTLADDFKESNHIFRARVKHFF